MSQNTWGGGLRRLLGALNGFKWGLCFLERYMRFLVVVQRVDVDVVGVDVVSVGWVSLRKKTTHRDSRCMWG